MGHLLCGLDALCGDHERVADCRLDVRQALAGGAADGARQQPERRLLPRQQRDRRPHDAALHLRLCMLQQR